MSASSLIDAALGCGTTAASQSTSTAAAAPPTRCMHVGPIWGSFERNTGTWTPYSSNENQYIEEAFQAGAATVEVPTCFNAVVHFNRAGGPHHQMTPAVGTKPAGFRSVLRGTDGVAATLYWWDTLRMWRLDQPVPITHTQEVGVSPPAASESFTWQWCDLTGRAAADAREINWHNYALEHGDEIEDAWARNVQKEITVGLTTYRIGGWQGSYGTQQNLTTGVVRQVRRGRLTVNASTPADYVEESCALCTEKFADTPEWPIRRTPCNHAYHWTCLQHILRQRGQQRCPMCRQSLAGMSSTNTTGAIGGPPPGGTNAGLVPRETPTGTYYTPAVVGVYERATYDLPLADNRSTPMGLHYLGESEGNGGYH